MAEDTKKEASLWSEILSTYRDVEIARREQPKIVQGAAQVQIPYTQNLNAPSQPVNISASGLINSAVFPQYLLYGGLSLLAVALLIKLKS